MTNQKTDELKQSIEELKERLAGLKKDNEKLEEALEALSGEEGGEVEENKSIDQ